ncbi:beta-glucosidase [Rhodococcus spelaei]|uniref:Exo-alpha-(1->6)-L-arabinopyranosidase n=1 Tax=Rhodococcus spelaei TaxID=2546320 RepID=A0A541BPA6_9NOCA|nr:glycoside hydrolase family 3 C-terminal domain-containing protein [Rhodococcus spelaei]TQF74130.1 beta-glucosidase [Rhodococcus spelaei]
MAHHAHSERIAGLSRTQKATLTTGVGFWHTAAVPDASIPSIMLTDGPHGLRKQSEGGDALGLGDSVPATCFPPAAGLGSSWNVDLIHTVGAALGTEARAEGVSVLLGPGVNIRRSPLCGRNFEYYSEDPFLAGVLGAAWVQGVQSRGVAASLKHFAANNQETDRMRIDVQADERTLREIYLPAFERIVTTARPWTVMCSYNKVRGVQVSENRWLLTEVLRDEWGFDGLVMSDWGAVNDRVRALAAGLDLTMPAAAGDDRVVAAVEAGGLDESVLDRAVGRLLTLLDRTAAPADDPAGYDAGAHHDLAAVAATESAVLLKNDGVLPLDLSDLDRVAVIGEFARTPRFQGSGSSQVVPTRVDSALDAIGDLAGEGAAVRFAPGFRFDGTADPELVAEAVALAEQSATVLLFLGLPTEFESEGFDRTGIDLPANQLALIDAVAAVNPRVAVVLSNGAVVATASWQDRAQAILEGWLLGQAGGSALADLLFGLANPSGRLTETIPLRLADTPSRLNFPGSDGVVVYGERIHVGYRWFDTLDLPVAYPFGFGLSYTTFEYSDLALAPSADGLEVSFTVTNTGDRAGAEVPQVYVRDVEASVDRPAHELKGFTKAHLAPGEARRVTVSLDGRAFAFWSVREHRWVIEAGDFEIRVGASSRDIRLARTWASPGDGIPATLTGMSTIGDWFAHPIGGPLLLAAFADAGGGDGAGFGDVDPLVMKMAAGAPLAKMASFAPGMTADRVEGLVEAVRAQSTLG